MIFSSTLRINTRLLKKSVSYFQPSNLRNVYEVVSNLAQSYPVDSICLILGISFSAYYAWARKETYTESAHKQTLAKEFKGVFEEHRSRYGAIRISKELQARGVKIDGRPLPSSSGTNIDEAARFKGYSA